MDIAEFKALSTIAYNGNTCSELSTYLTKYLELVIGSHEVVMARQQVIAESNMTTSCFHQIIYTGSLSEGFSLPGQDEDIMIVLKTIPVYEYETPTVPTDRLCVRLMCDERYTGSVMLEVFNSNRNIASVIPEPSINYLFGGPNCECYNDRLVLNASKLKESFFAPHYSHILKTKTAGPVLNARGLDMAIAIPIQFWPKCALEWINRKRVSKWPRESLIQFIISNVGCHAVPTYDVKCGEQDLLWRLSFSRAETILVSSLSYGQFRLFAIMKLFLKYAINEGIAEEEKFLTSYHIKNVIFHMTESFHGVQWTDELLLARFWDCIVFLRKSFLQNYLPHYFLPVLNLFLKRWNVGSRDRTIIKIEAFILNKDETIKVLFSILQSHVKINCKIYGDRLFNAILDKEYVNDSMIWGGVDYLNNVFEDFLDAYTYSEQNMKEACIQFTQEKSITLTRIHLENLSYRSNAKSIDYLKFANTLIETKQSYYLIRKSKRLLLFCCNADISRGRLTLAYYYYKILDFVRCVQVCKDILTRLNKPWVGNDIMYLNLIAEHHLGIFEKFKIANIFASDFHSICPIEFQLEFKSNNHLNFMLDKFCNIPMVYASIFIFVSCKEQGDVRGCLQAVRELQRQTLLTGDNDNSQHHAVPIYSCIGVCWEVLGDVVQAKLKYLKAIDIYPQYYPAITRFRKLLKR